MKEEYTFSFRSQFKTMASLSVYRAGMKQCPAGYTHGPEVPDFYSLYYVISGEGTYSLNEREFPVEQGQCFLLYPNMPAERRSGADDPLQYCWVGFNGADARLLADAAGFSPENPVLSPRSPEKLGELIMDIYQNRGQKLHRLIGMTARLYALLALLIEDAVRKAGSRPIRNGLGHVEQACDFIAKNYHRNISVDDIADQVYLSRSRLYRLFMQHVSLSPQQYLTEFRIRKACELMQKQQGTIKEIASAVGIEDPLYFSTVFKRVTGSAPSDYMKKIADHNLHSEVEASVPQPSPEALQQIGSQAGILLAKMFLEHPAEFSTDRTEMLRQLKQYLVKAVDDMIQSGG